MATKRYKFQPDYAVHPGLTLKEKLEEIGMSPKEFAIRTGKPVKTIFNILNCKSSITPGMAIRFEKVLGIPADFWNSKQSSYFKEMAKKGDDKLIDMPESIWDEKEWEWIIEEPTRRPR